jgi:hypothetical protein
VGHEVLQHSCLLVPYRTVTISGLIPQTLDFARNPPPVPSNTFPPSLTPLNSPDRSRCSRVVLFRQKPRAKHPRTLFLTKALSVRGVRGFGPFWPNPSTGRLDGLLGSFMSVWAHQNLRKYPLEGFWGCVLSSRKPQNPRKWRVGCRWGQSLYM